MSTRRRALFIAAFALACSGGSVAGPRTALRPAGDRAGRDEVLVVAIGAERAGCPSVRMQLPFPLGGGEGNAFQEVICADGRRKLEWMLQIQPTGKKAWRLTIRTAGGGVPRDLTLGENPPFQLDDLQVGVSLRTERIDG